MRLSRWSQFRKALVAVSCLLASLFFSGVSAATQPAGTLRGVFETVGGALPVAPADDPTKLEPPAHYLLSGRVVFTNSRGKKTALVVKHGDFTTHLPSGRYSLIGQSPGQRACPEVSSVVRSDRTTHVRVYCEEV